MRAIWADDLFGSFLIAANANSGVIQQALDASDIDVLRETCSRRDPSRRKRARRLCRCMRASGCSSLD